MSSLRPLPVLLLAAWSGCAHFGPRSPQSELLERFPKWRSCEFVVTERTGDAEPVPVTWRVTLVEKKPGADGTRNFEETVVQVREGSEPSEFTGRIVVDFRGESNIASRSGPTGEFASFEPAQLALPVSYGPGRRWESTHDIRGERMARACETRVYAGCEGGITVACTTTWAEKSTKVMLDHHYCPGVGLDAFDAKVEADEFLLLEHGSRTSCDGRIEP